MSAAPGPLPPPAAPRPEAPEPPGSLGLSYHQLLRGGAWSWWRLAIGAILALLLVLVLQVVAVLLVTIGLLVGGVSLTDVSDSLSGDRLTPSFLTAVNLGWALAIPALWLVVWALHRLRPGWLASVAPRIRWRWLLICLGLALVTLLITVVVAAAIPQGDAAQTTGSLDGSLNAFTTTSRDFLLVIVLLTPLQAAGEEYAFRGYLTQAIGGLVRNARASMVLAVVVPALLFALAHGLGQDLPVFFDRFAFGLVAGVLVIATGGLEAGIAMHVLNNWFAFGLALAFGDIGGALEPTGGSWTSIITTLVQSLVFLGLAVPTARRLGLATRSRPGVLGPVGARV